MGAFGPFDHEDIYADIGSYCDAIGRTPEELVEEKWKEIEYLQNRYDSLVDKRNDMEWALLCKEINGVIHSKRKTLDRIQKWIKKTKEKK